MHRDVNVLRFFEQMILFFCALKGIRLIGLKKEKMYKKQQIFRF